MRHLAWVLTAALSLGCGNETANETGQTGGGSDGGAAGAGGSADGGSAGDGGVTGGAPGTGGTSGTGATRFCPSAPPDTGDECDPSLAPDSGFQAALAHCAWGTDPRPECRTTALCQQNGTWLPSESDDVRCAEPALPEACPDPPPDPQSECDNTALGCWYPGGQRCWCSECRGGSGFPVCQTVDPPEWACATPGPGCPEVIPNAGAPCDSPGASCGPDCERAVVCEDGAWQWREGICPICASPDTPIATPSGERTIGDLAVGDLVYSVDRGAVTVVPIRQVGSTPASSHHVVRVTLRSGAVLEMSAGHPTGEGVPFGALRPGDAFDEISHVRSVEVVRYPHDRTYDILPDSTSGTYFAAGAWVGSTLGAARHRSLPSQSQPLSGTHARHAGNRSTTKAR